MSKYDIYLQENSKVLKNKLNILYLIFLRFHQRLRYLFHIDIRKKFLHRLEGTWHF